MEWLGAVPGQRWLCIAGELALPCCAECAPSYDRCATSQLMRFLAVLGRCCRAAAAAPSVGVRCSRIPSVGGTGERPAAGRVAQENDGVEFAVLDQRFAGRQRTDGPSQPGVEVDSSFHAAAR